MRLGASRPLPAAVAKIEPPALPTLSVEPVRRAAEHAFVVPAEVPTAEAAAQSSPRPAAAAASGPDPGAVARFRIDLLRIVALDKKYPRIAQDNDWTGTVELGVAIGADGSISSIAVKKSAGHAVLDDEAQSMIRAAQSKMAIPPALGGTPFHLDVAVDFHLGDEAR